MSDVDSKALLPNRAARIVKRIWVWILNLTILVLLWPPEYRITRIGFLTGIFVTWFGALLLWWHKKVVRAGLNFALAILIFAACLPGRPVDPQNLALDYVRCLRYYRGVRYIWGGEKVLGIDCSGLVRKELVWGLLSNGIRNLNGNAIRDSFVLWWNDGSAEDLKAGYGGWTSELFRSNSVEAVDPTQLKLGDLAVTVDGVHVMAYIGTRTWIEADPDAHHVIEVTIPTENHWFKVPVVLVRWKWLAESKTL